MQRGHGRTTSITQKRIHHHASCYLSRCASVLDRSFLQVNQSHIHTHVHPETNIASSGIGDTSFGCYRNNVKLSIPTLPKLFFLSSLRLKETYHYGTRRRQEKKVDTTSSGIRMGAKLSQSLCTFPVTHFDGSVFLRRAVTGCVFFLFFLSSCSTCSSLFFFL